MEKLQRIEDLLESKRNKKLVAVAAHPDDETAIWPGLLYLSSLLGWRTTLIVLNKGEGGTNFAPELDDRYPGIRVSEMQAAADILNVHDLIQEDFGDGKLVETEFYWKPKLYRRIQTIDPGLVVGFDPVVGITGHLDHRVSGRALAEYAERRTVDLLQATYIKEQFRPAVPVEREAHMPVPTHRLDLTSEAIERQLAAIAAHRSQDLAKQWGSFEGGILDWRARLTAMPWEHYRRVS